MSRNQLFEHPVPGRTSRCGDRRHRARSGAGRPDDHWRPDLRRAGLLAGGPGRQPAGAGRWRSAVEAAGAGLPARRCNRVRGGGLDRVGSVRQKQNTPPAAMQHAPVHRLDPRAPDARGSTQRCWRVQLMPSRRVIARGQRPMAQQVWPAQLGQIGCGLAFRVVAVALQVAASQMQRQRQMTQLCGNGDQGGIVWSQVRRVLARQRHALLRRQDTERHRLHAKCAGPFRTPASQQDPAPPCGGCHCCSNVGPRSCRRPAGVAATAPGGQHQCDLLRLRQRGIIVVERQSVRTTAPCNLACHVGRLGEVEPAHTAREELAVAMHKLGGELGLADTAQPGRRCNLPTAATSPNFTMRASASRSSCRPTNSGLRGTRIHDRAGRVAGAGTAASGKRDSSSSAARRSGSDTVRPAIP